MTRPPMPPSEPAYGYQYVDNRGNWQSNRRRLHWVTWVCFGLTGLSVAATATEFLYPNLYSVPIAFCLVGIGWIILTVAKVQSYRRWRAFRRSVIESRRSA